MLWCGMFRRWCRRVADVRRSPGRIFGFRPKKTRMRMSVTVGVGVPDVGAAGERTCSVESNHIVMFRHSFYSCLTRRADALFELCDAVLCVEGPGSPLVGLSLAPGDRGGVGGLFCGVG